MPVPACFAVALGRVAVAQEEEGARHVDREVNRVPGPLALSAGKR
jgi:hypothetical protein